MKRLLTIILLLLPMVICAQQVDIESRYKQIDKAIAEFPRYVAQREAKITAARNAFEQSSGQQKYEESYRLYELYRPFVSDSAIYFLRQCIDIAEQQSDHNGSVRCRSRTSGSMMKPLISSIPSA